MLVSLGMDPLNSFRRAEFLREDARARRRGTRKAAHWRQERAGDDQESPPRPPPACSRPGRRRTRPRHRPRQRSPPRPPRPNTRTPRRCPCARFTEPAPTPQPASHRDHRHAVSCPQAPPCGHSLFRDRICDRRQISHASEPACTPGPQQALRITHTRAVGRTLGCSDGGAQPASRHPRAGHAAAGRLRRSTTASRARGCRSAGRLAG